MDDTSLYPNDGTYYHPSEPVEQKERRAKAKAKAHSNKPLLQEVVERLEQRIAFYQRIDSIPNDVISDPKLLMATVAAHKQTVANLEVELQHWSVALQAL